MRDKLISYVNLLFAGAHNAEDIKQEILQNTLDRYDDLISQGKSPESAYSLAISGIGDLGEILSASPSAPQNHLPSETKSQPQLWRTVLRAVAVMLYILCPVPLFVMGEVLQSDIGDTLGLCGLLGIVAVATALLIIANTKKANSVEYPVQPLSPRSQLNKDISRVVWIIALLIYFPLSFKTGAWHITWLLFPLAGAVNSLIRAGIDYTEAEK